MALGTSSFPSVTTGFTKDSKAMVPVSIQGVGGQLQKMSSFDTMQEIFFDIRDGISNLIESIKNQTGLLHSTLLGVIHTLTNIGNIVAKDLDLEETQTNIAKENEEDEDKRESFNDDENDGKSIIPPALKKGFTNTVEFIKNLSFIESLIALGAGLFLLMFNYEKIASAIGGTVKAMDEHILPRVKAFGSTIFELGGNLIDGLFGENGVFPVIFNGLGGVVDDIKKGEGKAAIIGVGDTLLKGTLSIISGAGVSTLGLLKVAMKTVDPETDTSDIDEIIQFFNDLIPNASKKLDEDMKEFYKVREEKGKFAAAGVLLRQTYDNVGAKFLNGIAKASAIILRPLVTEDYYEGLFNTNMESKVLKSELRSGLESVADSLELMENAISIFVNDKLDAINGFTSIFGIPAIPKMPVKQIEGQNVYVNDEGMTVPMYSELNNLSIMGKPDPEPIINPIDTIMKQLEEDANTITIGGKKIYLNGFDDKNVEAPSSAELSALLDNKDSNMTLKTKELKAAASASQSESTSIVVPNFITDNKQIDNSNNSSQAVTVTDQRVDSMEGSSNALLAYFRQ